VRLISPPSTPGVFVGYGYSDEHVDIVRLGLNYRFGGAVGNP
jgi:hypothetical protein